MLEAVGRTFLEGYAHALEARSVEDAESRLEQVAAPLRGFAYEGAGMGFAMLDGLPFGHRHHVADFLEGKAGRHVYMVYVGIGWAMARLPRFRWPKADSLDPLLRGLVLDGYGFHQAYFHTGRYVHERYQDPGFSWPDDASRSYSHHAIDQGIGRAMWFVGGTDAVKVASLIDAFPVSRQADLYSGAALAATYAGGADERELHVLRDRAGRFRQHLAQASAFAAEARVRAGLLVPHTAVATRVLCGTTPESAARITQDVRPSNPVNGDVPAYELWRQRIADEFATLGGVHS
ncbi:Protein of unknown function [Amycolatopsis marina]|uniref:Enediyne biosynthesis protein n=2 Tax=Amycolatopsis marina TaxID=490629 RepID=A0A1I0ZIZ4_9PSEU|nr:Protein of unknown function [Amycolatopsis marina]